jgi:hypothetical protein
MDLSNVNLVAVVVGAVLNMALGFLWYSPYLFAKPWMAAMGLTAEKMKGMQKQMGPLYGLSFVGTLLTAFVLGAVLHSTGNVELSDALPVAFWLWLGFITPVQMTEVIFGGKNWTVYLINTGYQLAAMLIMAAVYSFLG